MRALKLHTIETTPVQRAIAMLQRDKNTVTLAAVLATMRIEPDPNCKTAATDAVRVVKYNPDWFDEIPLAEVAGVLAHEACHKFGMIHLRFEDWAKRHPQYDRGQLRMVFNVAHDYLINYSLRRDWGLTVPEEGLYDPNYHMGLYTIETLADKLLADIPPPPPGDGAAGDAGDEAGSGKPGQQGQQGGAGGRKKGQPNLSAGKGRDEAQAGSGGIEDGDDVMLPKEYLEQRDKLAQATGRQPSEVDPDMPLNEDAKNQIRAQVLRDLAEAERMLQGYGITSGDTVTHGIFGDLNRTPLHSLSRELAKLAHMTQRDRQSYAHPHRRRSWPTGVHKPGPRTDKMGTLVIAVDTSGSTKAEGWAMFLKTAEQTLRRARFEDVYIIHCDSKVNHVERYSFDRFVAGGVKREIYGGGGTNFWPTFDWVQENLISKGKKVAAMIYFSDAEIGHADVRKCYRIWKQGQRYPLIWGLFGFKRYIDTFANWVRTDMRFGTVSVLPRLVR